MYVGGSTFAYASAGRAAVLAGRLDLTSLERIPSALTDIQHQPSNSWCHQAQAQSRCSAVQRFAEVRATEIAWRQLLDDLCRMNV